MDQWDRELAKAGIQMAGAAAKGMGNVMVAVIGGLIEKGVFSIEEVRDMLDRLEATARRAEGEIEGDLAQEAEVAATMAIVDHLRDIVNGGAKLVHPGGAKLVHLMLCGTRCWGVVPVVHRRDPRCFV